jgi:hypothetical protein
MSFWSASSEMSVAILLRMGKWNPYLPWRSARATGGERRVRLFLNRVENPRLVVDPPPYRQSNVLRDPSELMDFDRIKD